MCLCGAVCVTVVIVNQRGLFLLQDNVPLKDKNSFVQLSQKKLTTVFPRQTNPEPTQDELLTKSMFAPLILSEVRVQGESNNSDSSLSDTPAVDNEPRQSDLII